jgi:hypothetical protein
MHFKYLTFIIKVLDKQQVIRFLKVKQDLIVQLIRSQMSIVDAMFLCSDLESLFQIR